MGWGGGRTGPVDSDLADVGERERETGPRERGIETLCAEAPAFIQSTDTVELNPQVRRDL